MIVFFFGDLTRVGAFLWNVLFVVSGEDMDTFSKLNAMMLIEL